MSAPVWIMMIGCLSIVLGAVVVMIRIERADDRMFLSLKDDVIRARSKARVIEARIESLSDSYDRQFEYIEQQIEYARAAQRDSEAGILDGVRNGITAVLGEHEFKYHANDMKREELVVAERKAVRDKEEAAIRAEVI